MIVDAHAIVLPERVRRDYRKLKAVEPRAFAFVFNHPEVEPVLPMASQEGLLRSMEQAGIDQSVIMSFGWRQQELCQECNDYVKACAASEPSRLIPFAVVQPKAGQAAVDELRRRLEEDGFQGLKLTPHFQGITTDDPSVYPLIEVLIKHKAPLLVHVDHPFQGPDRDLPYHVLALARRYPEAKIIAAHLGGLLCLYNLWGPVRAQMENLYFDTAVSATMEMVEFATRVNPAHKIIFGTDFPFNHCHSQGVVLDGLNALAIDPAVKRRILGENLLALLPSWP